MLVKGGRGESLAAEAGLAEGGEASPPSFAEDFYTIAQHALLPLNEVRRILRLRPCRRPPPLLADVPCFLTASWWAAA